MKRQLIRIAMSIIATGPMASCSSSSSNGPGGSPAGDGGNPDGTVTCGGSGDPCCNGTACNTGLTCSGGTCSGAGQVEAGADSGGGLDAGDAAQASDAPACTGTGLTCQIHACADAGTTTIRGTIYDPAGKNPLYGAVAYVPNAPVTAFSRGASRLSCAEYYSGSPVAAAVTDANGVFTIANAPDGLAIPLVIQTGKWRRQFTLPSVARCGETDVPDKTLTLPKKGSEGDLPHIAISTGAADTLECLLSRVGVDPGEYVPGDSDTGHIHIFHGTGGPDTSSASPSPELSLWDSGPHIARFDLVVLSCEGHETDNMNQQVLFDYAAGGGRVMASHFHYAWFNTGPFGAENLATWTAGSNAVGNINADAVTTRGGLPFVRGQALHDWLVNVHATTGDAGNLLPLQAANHNADVTSSNTLSQPWVVVDGTTQQAQIFTFDTPFGGDAGGPYGRVAFTDLHVGAAAGDYGAGLATTTPAGCAANDLSPQEKALEFSLFDLSSCVTPNNSPVALPATGP